MVNYTVLQCLIKYSNKIFFFKKFIFRRVFFYRQRFIVL